MLPRCFLDAGGSQCQDEHHAEQDSTERPNISKWPWIDAAPWDDDKRTHGDKCPRAENAVASGANAAHVHIHEAR